MKLQAVEQSLKGSFGNSVVGKQIKKCISCALTLQRGPIYIAAQWIFDRLKLHKWKIKVAVSSNTRMWPNAIWKYWGSTDAESKDVQCCGAWTFCDPIGMMQQNSYNFYGFEICDKKVVDMSPSLGLHYYTLNAKTRSSFLYCETILRDWKNCIVKSLIVTYKKILFMDREYLIPDTLMMLEQYENQFHISSLVRKKCPIHPLSRDRWCITLFIELGDSWTKVL